MQGPLKLRRRVFGSQKAAHLASPTPAELGLTSEQVEAVRRTMASAQDLRADDVRAAIEHADRSCASFLLSAEVVGLALGVSADQVAGLLQRRLDEAREGNPDAAQLWRRWSLVAAGRNHWLSVLAVLEEDRKGGKKWV